MVSLNPYANLLQTYEASLIKSPVLHTGKLRHKRVNMPQVTQLERSLARYSDSSTSPLTHPSVDMFHCHGILPHFQLLRLEKIVEIISTITGTCMALSGLQSTFDTTHENPAAQVSSIY